eukprot:SAG25_NODE_5439_length_657_cov_1.476703_1_plen_143_part_10
MHLLAHARRSNLTARMPCSITHVGKEKRADEPATVVGLHRHRGRHCALMRREVARWDGGVGAHDHRRATADEHAAQDRQRLPRIGAAGVRHLGGHVPQPRPSTVARHANSADQVVVAAQVRHDRHRSRHDRQERGTVRPAHER